MRPAANSPGGAGVAAITFLGFLVIAFSAAAIGSYIGRQVNAHRAADATPSPSVSAPAQPSTPAPNAAAPAANPAPAKP